VDDRIAILQQFQCLLLQCSGINIFREFCIFRPNRELEISFVMNYIFGEIIKEMEIQIHIQGVSRL
jgi:hypothetical protein